MLNSSGQNNKMKINKLTIFALLLFLAISPNHIQAQTVTAAKTNISAKSVWQIEEKNVRAHMEFLASDAMQGRGSGTQFEWIAGQYIGSQMQQFGVEPAGDKDASGKTGYVQTVNITRNIFAENPKLSYQMNGENIILEQGKEMIVYQISADKISGELQKIKDGVTPKKGAVLFIRADDENSMDKLDQFRQDASLIIVEESPQIRVNWNRFAARPVSFTNFGETKKNSAALVFVNKDAADALAKAEDGTKIEIGGKLGEPELKQTWNAIGMIKGSDAKLGSEIILLSAHMDHLGVRENNPGEDKIFNGADDDASGCIAVLELSRIIAEGKQPKRTVYFVFFGSEEAGGYGANYFVNNLPFPKEKLVANLEFEMIGRPDPKVAADELWLTGYDRSNLGSELAKQGAKLVNDPHPEQNFFQRSDNYTLARQGIIAHTVSSFNLHTDYHHASDEIETIDFSHMTKSINSMINPIEWLVNSDFKPTWYEGKRPL